MKKKWRALPRERKYILFGALITVVLLLLYGWAGNRRGIWYEGAFLYRQEPYVWQGEVYGEELTIRKTVRENGGTLLLSCPSGEKEFRVEGREGYGETMTLFEDGVSVFTGSIYGGHLWTSDGANGLDLEKNHVVSVTHTESGAITEIKENGEFRRRTPLDMDRREAVGLIVSLQEESRVYPGVVWTAALLCAMAFAELWWPELWFRMRVGRFVHGDAESSEYYESIRVVRIVCVLICAAAVLIMGFVIQ